MPRSFLDRFADRVRLLLGYRRRDSMDDRLSAEVRFHIDMAAEQHQRAGMSAADARRAALVAFGGREAWRESARDEYRSRHLEELGQDVRYALRGLRQSPGFAAAATATLALSIGATVAIFSVVNAVLLERLPYPQPDRIVALCEHNLVRSISDCNVLNPGNYMDWQDRARYLQSMGAYFDRSVGIAAPGSEPVSVLARLATGGMFDVLRPPVVEGRTFTDADAAPDGPNVMVLSSAFWQQHFGGDPRIVGRRVTVNATPYTIVGVLSPRFQIFEPADVWIPLRLPAEYRTAGGRSISGIARLRPGATLDQANTDMRVMAAQAAAARPGVDAHWTAFVRPLRQNLVGSSARALWLLLGAVGFLLLIACANVANLMLARAATREREVAVRVSLGASPGRIVRQLLTESLVLSCAAAAIGLLLAVKGTRVVIALAPSGLSAQSLAHPGVDWRVLAFTTAIAVLTGVMFGLAPASQAAGGGVHDTLKEGGRGGSGASRASARLRAALVVAEISLAVVLLAGAGLMARSLAALQDVPLGFQPDHVLTAQVSLPGATYGSDSVVFNFFNTLVPRVAAMPGVRSVGAISFLPLTGQRAASGFNVEGQPAAGPGEEPVGDMRAVTPGYFAAMGIRIIAGRDIGQDDRANSPSVAVVSERLARTFWPNESAVGHYLLYSWGKPLRVRIVGVAANVHAQSADAEPYMEIYRPFSQFVYNTMTLVVRGTDDPSVLAVPLRNAVHQLDAQLPVGSVQTMNTLVTRSMSKSQLSTTLFGMFGGLGLLLAGIGIYGVMSYTVQQRSREMGIRMALGAQPGSVLRLVLGRGLRLAIAGIAIGVVGALAATRLMRSLLFGVAPADRVTFVAVPVVLALIALAAAYIPGRRATRLDVVDVLRSD